MSIRNWLPPALEANPVWTALADRMDEVWRREILSPLFELANTNHVDLDTLDREQLLRFARRIGWNFRDSFTADWENNPQAEKFVRQFIRTWGEFCRTKGDPMFVNYIGLLLQLPVNVHIMWAQATDSYDLDPQDNFDQGGTNVPAFGPALPVYPPISYGTLTRFNELPPGWQSIVDDPVNGWYPTSHVELEYDATDVPASNVSSTPPTEIMYNLFRVVAPIQLVLKSVITLYYGEGNLFFTTGQITRIHYT